MPPMVQKPEDERKDLWRIVVTLRADSPAEARRRILDGKFEAFLAHNLSEIHRKKKGGDSV